MNDDVAARQPDDDLDLIAAVSEWFHREKPDRTLLVEHALFVAVVTDETGTYVAYRSDDNIAQWTELGMLHTAIVMTDQDVLDWQRQAGDDT